MESIRAEAIAFRCMLWRMSMMTMNYRKPGETPSNNGQLTWAEHLDECLLSPL